MTKKAIWIVIGLMALALMGTTIVQLYWINWSVRLKEEQFNESIIAVLQRVGDRLEKHDPSLTLSSSLLMDEWNEKQKQIENSREERVNESNTITTYHMYHRQLEQRPPAIESGQPPAA